MFHFNKFWLFKYDCCLPGKDEGQVLLESTRVVHRIFRPIHGMVCLEEDCTWNQNNVHYQYIIKDH